MVHPIGHGNFLFARMWQYRKLHIDVWMPMADTYEYYRQMVVYIQEPLVGGKTTTSFLFMSSLLYCGIQSEYGTKNTTQTAFKKSLTTFSVSDRFVCGLLPTMGMVPNTISITRRDNQCHHTPTAVKIISSLFADCASCWESRSLSHGWVRRIESVL